MDTEDEWSADGLFLAYLGCVIFGITTLFASAIAVETIITAINNPEYWALKQLLK